MQALRERRDHNLYVLGDAEPIVSAAAESAPENDVEIRIMHQRIAAGGHCRRCLERARGEMQALEDILHPERIMGVAFVRRMIQKKLVTYKSIGTDVNELAGFSLSDKTMAHDIVHECRDDNNYARLPDLLTLLRYQFNSEDLGETDDSIHALEVMAMTMKAKELLAAFRAVPSDMDHAHQRNIAWLMFYQHALAMLAKAPGYRNKLSDFFVAVGMYEAEERKFQEYC